MSKGTTQETPRDILARLIKQHPDWDEARTRAAMWEIVRDDPQHMRTIFNEVHQEWLKEELLARGKLPH